MTNLEEINGSNSYDATKDNRLDAMKILYKRLISSQVLALTWANGRLALDTDICNVRVGFVLPQEQPDETKKPV